MVGIPQALSIYTYLPLWRRFFNRLGFRILLSGGTTQAVRDLGSRMSGAEFCFPAKGFLGHVASLASKEGVDFVFLPEMKNEVPSEHVTTSTFCPYVQASPSYARAALALNAMDSVRLLSPIVDLRLEDRTLMKRLASQLGPALDRSPRQIEDAWRDAYAVQREFEQRLRDEGATAIEEARAGGEKLLVIVGRSYNIYDSGLNLDLPEKLAEQGRTVLPIDFLTLDLARLGERYKNTYWGYGQKILAALEDVARNDLLDAVYFTNFSCGPDSFLLTYASEIMGSKPYLALELDEHGSDTGYMTRIEAFFDVLRRPRKSNPPRRPFVAPSDGDQRPPPLDPGHAPVRHRACRGRDARRRVRRAGAAAGNRADLRARPLRHARLGVPADGPHHRQPAGGHAIVARRPEACLLHGLGAGPLPLRPVRHAPPADSRPRGLSPTCPSWRRRATWVTPASTNPSGARSSRRCSWATS